MESDQHHDQIDHEDEQVVQSEFVATPVGCRRVAIGAERNREREGNQDVVLSSNVSTYSQSSVQI